MAVLAAQSIVAGVGNPNQADGVSLAAAINSQGVLTDQALLRGKARLSNGFSNSASANLSSKAFQFARQGDYHDYLSSLTRFFGDGFKQDSQYFYINKAALPGLTTEVNNNAEALLTGLLLRVKEYESNSLISRVTVEHWKTTYIDNYQSKILLIKLYADVKYSYSFNSINGIERGFILNADEKPTINDF